MTEAKGAATGAVRARHGLQRRGLGRPHGLHRGRAHAGGHRPARARALPRVDPRVTYADWIAADTFDAMTRIGEITAPTLALCGADDRLTPVKYHRYLQERIPGCRLVVIESAGHWSFHEQPTQFDHAVSAFLAGLPAGKGDQR